MLTKTQTQLPQTVIESWKRKGRSDNQANLPANFRPFAWARKPEFRQECESAYLEGYNESAATRAAIVDDFRQRIQSR